MAFGDKILEILDIKMDQAFGMDISDRSIEILELKAGFGFSVVTYGRVKLDGGIVEDGKILNKEGLAIKIKEVLLSVKPKKISTNKVILSLPESKVFIHYFNLDKSLKGESLRKAIEDEALKIIPLDLQKIYWDFQVKPSFVENKQSVVFIGTMREIADQYVEICQELGLEVVALDLESISLGRAILGPEKKLNLILDIGARTTNISIFDRNNLLGLSVTVSIAGQDFTGLIMKHSGLDENKAEEMKKSNNIISILQVGLDELIAEIKKAIDFYERKFSEKVEEVYLAGGSSLLQGLEEYFHDKLKLEARVVNPLKNIKFSKLLDKNISPVLFANVIGLAMRGVSNRFKGINFLQQIYPLNSKTPSNYNLFTAGYLRKTTVIRYLLNNRIFVITLLIISLLLLVFVIYYYILYI